MQKTFRQPVKILSRERERNAITLETGGVSLLADSTYSPYDSLNIPFDRIRIGDTVINILQNNNRRSLSANPNKQTNKWINKDDSTNKMRDTKYTIEPLGR